MCANGCRFPAARAPGGADLCARRAEVEAGEALSRDDDGVRPILVLEEGVMFEGHCRMPKPGAVDSAREAAVVPLKRS